MRSTEQHVLILELVDQLRSKWSWCGETHLQKAVYFMQELLSVPTGFEFVLYKHGPFSFELQDELTLLRAYELLKLEPQPNGYGPKLGLSTSGRVFKDQSSDIIDQHKRKVAWLATHLAKKGVVDLERLGTALYVSKENEMAGKTDDEIISRIHMLKPHVTEEQAKLALHEVRQMETNSATITA
jgi:uncharacterized protein YwgA